MATGLQVWSQTAATNATADSGVNWAEGMAPSAVNDSARTMMASLAKWRDDINATLMASGVSTALTLTTNQVEGALTAGYQASFTTTFDVGTPCTINVDSLGPKPLRRGPNVAILASQIKTGQPVRISYFTSNSGEWITDGTRGIVLASQVITTTGTTYTPTSGTAYAILECVGGGGAGGGTPTNAGGNDYGGGGGGGGGYTRKVVSATSLTSSQVVTIGAGGTGVSGAGGNNGGDTSVGSLCVAKGGTGGLVGAADNDVLGGAGGVAGTGDFTFIGEAGHMGSLTGNANACGGRGGAAGGGAGGGAINTLQNTSGTSVGAAGPLYGSGGGGAACKDITTAQTGGAGAAGIAIITEFI